MLRLKVFNSKEPELDKSELVPYFRKEEIDIFFNHPDFKEKYKLYSTTINAFIHEVRKNKKAIETIDIIKKYIINLEPDTMLKIIYLYINNKDEKDIFDIIDRKFELGKYFIPIEERIRIDQDYNLYKTGRETFNEKPLDTLFTTLNYPEKVYLNNLLKSQGGFNALKKLFDGRYFGNFELLLRLLNNKSVDYDILSDYVVEHLDEDQFRELVFTLLTNENKEIANYTKVLIENNRFDLINDMLDMNLFGDIVYINADLSDDIGIIKSIEDLKKKQLTSN